MPITFDSSAIMVATSGYFMVIAQFSGFTGQSSSNGGTWTIAEGNDKAEIVAVRILVNGSSDAKYVKFKMNLYVPYLHLNYTVAATGGQSGNAPLCNFQFVSIDSITYANLI